MILGGAVYILYLVGNDAAGFIDDDIKLPEAWNIISEGIAKCAG